MSTKERVIKIIDNWTEKQLEAFLVMFGADASEISEMDNVSAENEKIRKKVPDDFDDDKELAEYR